MSMAITRKWYSTAEVAEMLGYGLTKTKFLVLSGQLRVSERRGLPAHPPRMGGRLHPPSRRRAGRVSKRRNGEALDLSLSQWLRRLRLGDYARW